MENTKSIPTRSWSIGNIAITEWERLGKDNKPFRQYSISKSEFIKEENKSRNLFSFTLDKKEHIKVIDYLSRRKCKDLIGFLNYSIRPHTLTEDNKIENGFILSKTYRDNNTNEEKSIECNFTLYDLMMLEELIKAFIDEALIRRYYKDNKKSSNYGNPTDINNSVGFHDDGFIIEERETIDDDIPF